ncbi:hypothetical protein J2X97_000252 [Epilithonimonas hungarica]|nr:hypothetical protein [Epilithonimonas hungarica]
MISKHIKLLGGGNSQLRNFFINSFFNLSRNSYKCFILFKELSNPVINIIFLKMR